MKSVMLSIKPKYCELIATGKKTIEVRRTKPNLKPPFKCYIYMTKSNLVGDKKAYKDRMAGKVIGEFVCDQINVRTLAGLIVKEDLERTLKGSCLSENDIYKYLNIIRGKNIYERPYITFYLWHISNLVIYDKPKELDDFIKSNIPSFENLKENNIQTLCENCYRTNFGERADCVLTQFYNSYECDMGDCEKAYKNYIFDNYSLKCPPQSWCYVGR